eukprot:2953530-Rhodomonas_salina.1
MRAQEWRYQAGGELGGVLVAAYARSVPRTAYRARRRIAAATRGAGAAPLGERGGGGMLARDPPLAAPL